MLQMTEVRLTFPLHAKRPSLPSWVFFPSLPLMKRLCEVSPCANTNEDPSAQLKSQPVAEEETPNNSISLHAHIILMLQPAFCSDLMLKNLHVSNGP